jgi:cytidylate kinase
MSKSYFHIAIDGPVAAGKGTVSKLVAHRLGFLYVDTGAMYRMTAYLAHSKKVAYDDEPKIVELIKKSKMEMRTPNENEQDGRLITVFLNGEDVSWKIRTDEMSQGASKVSTLPKVRQVLVKKQQEIAQDQDVVMEGRDITYRVLPKADLKIFLTANTKERAERRLLQNQLKGFDLDLKEILQEIEERDARDMGRSADPLKILPSAWQLDTTKLSIEEVVEKIIKKVEALRKNNHHEKK